MIYYIYFQKKNLQFQYRDNFIEIIHQWILFARRTALPAWNILKQQVKWWLLTAQLYKNDKNKIFDNWITGCPFMLYDFICFDTSFISKCPFIPDNFLKTNDETQNYTIHFCCLFKLRPIMYCLLQFPLLNDWTLNESMFYVINARVKDPTDCWRKKCNINLNITEETDCWQQINAFFSFTFLTAVVYKICLWLNCCQLCTSTGVRLHHGSCTMLGL